jgi:hypothetical protein
MQSVSSRFLTELRESHYVALKATLYPPGLSPVVAKVIGGSLRADRDARVRRQGSLSVAFSLQDSAAVIRNLPFGGYAKLERGIQFADGSRELVPVGYLRIDALNWQGEAGEAILTLVDRMAQVQDEPFLVPWVPIGLKPSDAIKAAVYEVFGDTITYTIATTPASEPTIGEAVYDQDRAQAISDLASSISAEAYFTPDGNFRLAPSPDLNTLTPAWTVDAGEGGAMEDVQENLDRTSVRNGVAVRGQATPEAAPIFSLATDTDPASPTRWGGPFGKVALITSLTSVVTQAQADSTAASLLRLRLGLARTLTMASLPNPALEPGDAISVEFADGRTETQLVNAVEIPLDTIGPIRLVTTSQWRPDVAQPGRSLRLYSGDLAWQELQGAEVAEEVPA